MNSRPNLRPGLLTHRLDDQLVVYDTTDEQIHLLAGPTAVVYESLQEGAASDAIESKLDAQGVAPGAELLALALDELAKARLIESDWRESAPVMESRRQALQKLAGVGAALLIPAIVTLAPNTVYGQVTLFTNGTLCTLSNQCLSGCCATNSAGTCTNGRCSPNTCLNCQ